MNDRKAFSRTREDRIISVIDDAITSLRLEILRGEMDNLNSNDKESFIYESLRTLPEKVALAYRSSVRVPLNQQELDLG